MSMVTIVDAEITVDAALLADGFGVSEAKLRSLMRKGAITSRCERGEGEDSGRTRLNFLYGNRVLRLIVDGTGNPLAPARIDFLGANPSPGPSSRARAPQR